MQTKGIALKVGFSLPVRQEVRVAVPDETRYVTIGDADVEWITDSENILESIMVNFSRVEINFTDEGTIIPATEELQEQAYRLATYLANRLYVQTSFDAIDPEHVLLAAPMVSPETPYEEDLFKTTARRMWSSTKVGYAIRGHFKPEEYILNP